MPDNYTTGGDRIVSSSLLPSSHQESAPDEVLANKNKRDSPNHAKKPLFARVGTGAPVARNTEFPKNRESSPEQAEWNEKNIFPDRKSTRLNSSHANISYAVFCLKK